ncbi:putative molybdenum carrier protein [Belnapia sp. T6]|uniref:Molybdenum carrier protein n=1 Tax=Belnapia mucosa TaxID=2804532 RepID=A0ABS1V1L8_9PROT|nr:putative molybdenum carrier protein [Belnapia mucosa]MBL6455472.1 putative molybdenum carrier protein [Belnapia mucosa]
MRIISGGQTGADRAALDVALATGLPHGGKVPRGRWSEDGPIPDRYTVEALESTSPEQRTERNVVESDATLVVTRGPPDNSEGTKLTCALAEQHGKPFLHIDLKTLNEDAAIGRVVNWLRLIRCNTLNVAGPRKSEDEYIYDATFGLLLAVLARAEVGPPPLREKREFTLKIYEQFCNNFRHWDQIRWTGSGVLMAFLGTSYAALLTAINDHPLVVRGSMAAISATSILWIWLLIRLIIYHNSNLKNLEKLVKTSHTDTEEAGALVAGLPFVFSFPKIFRTASFWFLLVFFGLAVLGFFGAFYFDWIKSLTSTAPKDPSVCYFGAT